MQGGRNQQAKTEYRAKEVNSSMRRILVDDSLKGVVAWGLLHLY